MKRSSFLVTSAAAAGATCIPGRALAQADMALHTPTGSIAGTLLMPASAASPPPVVLIIPGSGSVDRDGNVPNGPFNVYKLLAEALARRGIASLRYDKRAVGASKTNQTEHDLTIEMYVQDAAGWVAQLRKQKRFARVAIAGHSEGSLIGMLAAQREPVDGYVSLEGAGRNAAQVLRTQLQGKLGPLQATSDSIIDSLLARKTVTDVPEQLMFLFRPSVQPYMISWFEYDPAAEIKNVKARTTIVQGTADIQVAVSEGNALHAADPSAAYVVVDGMNHVLKHAPDTSTTAAIQAGYIDPALPLDPAAVNAVASVALGT